MKWLLLLLIVLSSQAYALDVNDAKAAYQFNNLDGRDTRGTYNGTVNGSMTFTASMTGFGNASRITNIDQFIQINTADSNFPLKKDNTGSVSVSFLYRQSGTPATETHPYQSNANTNEFDLRARTNAVVAGDIVFTAKKNGGTSYNAELGSAVTSNVWQCFVMKYNGSNQVIQMYRNGTLIDTETYAGGSAIANTAYPSLQGRPGSTNALGVNVDVDEVVFWNKALDNAEITQICDYANNGTQFPYGLSFGPSASNLTITAINAQNGVSISILNATVNGTHYASTNSVINTLIPSSTNALVNISVGGECAAGFCNYTTQAYSNWNVSVDIQFNLTYWYNTTQTFNATIYEYQEQTMLLRVNHSNTSFGHHIDSVEAILIYNGTRYTANKNTFSDYTIFNVSFLTPTQPYGTNVSFVWSWNITRANAQSTQTFYFNQSGNQLVNIIGIDDCSVYTFRALNFTVYNESTSNQKLTSTLAAYFQTWIDSESSYRSFNLTWGANTSFGVCISDSAAQYTTYAQIVYSSSGFPTKTHYLTNASLTSATNHISLFLSSESSQVAFTVKDEDDNLVSEVYITILKYDPATNTATVTEIIKTGSDGTAIGNIILNDASYKFILTYSGEVVLETVNPGVVLTGTSYSFRVSLGTDYFESFEQSLNVQCSTYYTAPNQFTFSFSDASGITQQGCMSVTRISGTTSTILNSSCASGSSGTINAYFINSSRASNYVAIGYIVIDDQNFVCGSAANYNSFRVADNYNTEGVFASFFFILTLVCAGIWSAPASIVLFLVGFVFSLWLGIFSMGWGATIGIIAGGIVILYKVSGR